MFQKTLAVFLVLSWVGLAAVDLLEDLQLCLKQEVHSRTDLPSRSLAEGFSSVNNILESVDHSLSGQSNSLETAVPLFSSGLASIHLKQFKLYKLYHAFLI